MKSHKLYFDPKRDALMSKHGEMNACYVCGRPLDADRAQFIHVVGGGLEWTDDEDWPDDPGSLGCFPVGAFCYQMMRTRAGLHERPHEPSS